MAANEGSPAPLADALQTEESDGSGSSPIKRRKIETTTELAAGSNTKQGSRRSTSAAAAAGDGSSNASLAASTMNNPPTRLRCPPFPKGGTSQEVHKWSKECNKIYKILANDPRRKLATQRKKPKDPGTAATVQTSRDKAMIRRAAQSVVSVSSVTRDGSREQQCSGIVMGQRESNGNVGKQYTIVVTSAIAVCVRLGELLDPVPKLSVRLPSMAVVDGQLLFFDGHYGIAVLGIDVDFPLQQASIGSCPDYGDEVFVLARDGDSSLVVRHGEVLWSEESILLRSHQMQLGCKIPPCGDGGPVIDHDGNVMGMALRWGQDSNVLSISTIVACIEMWFKFGRIARPVHGMELRTIELLDVSLQEEIARDHGIDGGFIVDAVSYDSAAESLGILRGDVIVSIDGQPDLTLPQLDDYLLSLGWTCLNNSSPVVEVKLEVYDPVSASKRSLTLPLKFDR